MKALFRGKRKFASITAIALIAFVFWPFFLSASLGYLAYKKVPNNKLKLGIIGFLILMGIGSAPEYYARFASKLVAGDGVKFGHDSPEVDP